jgi:hypothetical protein
MPVPKAARAIPIPAATEAQEKYWMASGLAMPPAAKTSDENPRTKNTENPDKHKNFFIQSSKLIYCSHITKGG